MTQVPAYRARHCARICTRVYACDREASDSVRRKVQRTLCERKRPEVYPDASGPEL